MRITGSDIHRIIEEERRFQAAAHRRRDEMLRIKGRDLRRLVRETLIREAAFPEEIEGLYGMEPPEGMEEDEAEGPLDLVSAALEGDTEALGDMAAEFMAMSPGDMMKFSVDLMGPDAQPVYVTRASAETWVVANGAEPEEAREYEDPEDAAVGVVAQCRMAMIGDEEADEMAEWEPEEEMGDDFDPMADWMEDEKRATSRDDY